MITPQLLCASKEPVNIGAGELLQNNALTERRREQLAQVGD